MAQDNPSDLLKVYNQILEYLEGIRKDRKELYKKLSEASNAYELAKNEIDKDMKKLQERCPHINTKYTPDASGNNDSSTDCEDCGAYLGR